MLQVHLFDVEVQNGPILFESKHTAPGTKVGCLRQLQMCLCGEPIPVCAVLQLVTCESPAGRLGVTVCYDLRFPEVSVPFCSQHPLLQLLSTETTGPCRFTSCWPGTMEPTSCWSPARSLWLQVRQGGLVPACRRCSSAWHIPAHRALAS